MRVGALGREGGEAPLKLGPQCSQLVLACCVTLICGQPSSMEGWGGPVWLMQGLLLQSSVKLRLLCSQVLKELLGQGIDVSAGPSTPLFHDPLILTALKVHQNRGWWRGGQSGCRLGCRWLVSRGLAPPEGLLSP